MGGKIEQKVWNKIIKRQLQRKAVTIVGKFRKLASGTLKERQLVALASRDAKLNKKLKLKGQELKLNYFCIAFLLNEFSM